MTPTKFTILLADVAIFFCILYATSLDTDLAKGLSIFVFIAILWITEVFHVSITSLLVPVLAVLLNVFDINLALSQFSNPILFLFMGGFALAAAMHKHKLDQFIAGKLMKFAKGDMLISSFIIFGITAFSSMWISNTATVAMMMPLVIGLLSRLDFDSHKPTYLYFLLGTAYSGSIGGMGTLIGSPPNAIAASVINLSFTQWLLFGVPMVLISLPFMIALLYFFLRPQVKDSLSELKLDFTHTRESKTVLLIFFLTVLSWVFSKPLAELIGVTGSIDALIAITAIILLSASHVVKWKEIAESTDWGVLILFGGGITLSNILKVTGASLFLAGGIIDFINEASTIVFILLTITFVVFLTELASNTASTALLIPIFIAIAESLKLDASVIAIVIALAASCAFMLPVATPPNAIVFGTGYVLQKDMMKIGFLMNMTLIALISLLASVFI